MSKLERIVHDDSNGLDYILVGEIYLPLIAVSEEKRDIGFYGSLHRGVDLPCRLKWAVRRMQRFSHESDHGTGRYYRGIEKQRSNGMGSPGKQCEKPGR